MVRYDSLIRDPVSGFDDIRNMRDPFGDLVNVDVVRDLDLEQVTVVVHSQSELTAALNAVENRRLRIEATSAGSPYSVTKSGVTQSPLVTITSYDPNDQAVFSTVTLTSCSNFYVTGVTFQDIVSPAVAVSFTNCYNCTVKANNFYLGADGYNDGSATIGAEMVGSTGSSYITIEDNLCYGPGWGIQFGGVYNHIIIRRNLISYFQLDAIQMQVGGCSDILIDANIIFYSYGTPYASNHDDGIQLFTSGGTGPAVRITITNNIIINNGWYGGYLTQGGIFMGDEDSLGYIDYIVNGNLVHGGGGNGIIVRSTTNGEIAYNVVGFDPYALNPGGGAVNGTIYIKAANDGLGCVNVNIHDNYAETYDIGVAGVTGTNNKVWTDNAGAQPRWKWLQDIDSIADIDLFLSYFRLPVGYGPAQLQDASLAYAPVPPNDLVSAIGDSVRNQDIGGLNGGYLQQDSRGSLGWARGFSEQRFYVPAVAIKGVSGNRTDQMLARFNTDIATLSLPDRAGITGKYPACCTVEGWINDITQGKDFAWITSNLMAIHNAHIAAGGTLTFIEGTHPSAAASPWNSTQRQLEIDVNTWINTVFHNPHLGRCRGGDPRLYIADEVVPTQAKTGMLRDDYHPFSLASAFRGLEIGYQYCNVFPKSNRPSLIPDTNYMPAFAGPNTGTKSNGVANHPSPAVTIGSSVLTGAAANTTITTGAALTGNQTIKVWTETIGGVVWQWVEVEGNWAVTNNVQGFSSGVTGWGSTWNIGSIADQDIEYYFETCVNVRGAPEAALIYATGQVVADPISGQAELGLDITGLKFVPRLERFIFPGSATRINPGWIVSFLAGDVHLKFRVANIHLNKRAQ